jgi:hypothetical protein
VTPEGVFVMVDSNGVIVTVNSLLCAAVAEADCDDSARASIEAREQRTLMLALLEDGAGVGTQRGSPRGRRSARFATAADRSAEADRGRAAARCGRRRRTSTLASLRAQGRQAGPAKAGHYGGRRTCQPSRFGRPAEALAEAGRSASTGPRRRSGKEKRRAPEEGSP